MTSPSESAFDDENLDACGLSLLQDAQICMPVSPGDVQDFPQTSLMVPFKHVEMMPVSPPGLASILAGMAA